MPDAFRKLLQKSQVVPGHFSYILINNRHISEAAGCFSENLEKITGIDSRPFFENVRAEMADVLLYLIRLSDKLGVDLIGAANAKIVLNAAKYPVDKAHGSSKKYTEF